MMIFSAVDKRLTANLLKLLAALLLLSTTVTTVMVASKPPQPTISLSGGEYSLRLSDYDSPGEFVRQLGWDTGDQPETVRTVTIPMEFNLIYQRYNALQQSQGLNLEAHRGAECVLMHFPTVDHKIVSLLVKNGQVIGGDVCGEEFGSKACNLEGKAVSLEDLPPETDLLQQQAG